MASSCPDCGHEVVLPDAIEAQRRIEDLQAQVKLLNTKASAAVDRLADYEDEIRSLRTQCAQLQDDRRPATQDGSKSLPPPPAEKRQSMTRLASLTSLLPMRRKSLAPEARQLSDSHVPPTPGLPANFSSSAANRSSPNLSTNAEGWKHSPTTPQAPDPGPKVPTLTLLSLQTSLENERELRQKAETNLTQAQSELEELTAQLFGQANEMVATERKARAKLEERVKLLEKRDGDKRRRLERLEKALERIERVRRMVVEHEQESERRNEKMLMMKLQIQQNSNTAKPVRIQQSSANTARRELDEVDEDEVYDEFEKKRYHEWDVSLKVWRRSQAHQWRSPS